MVEVYCKTPGDKYQPTLLPYLDFDAESDCNNLRNAMKGLGTDEETLINILTNRSSLQRAEIVKKYKSMFGKDLVDVIKSETSKHFEDVLVALCSTLVEFDARELRWAMKGAGTNEKALIEILCTRTPDQLAMLKETYEQLFPGHTLEQDIEGDTSGHVRCILVAVLQGDRDRNYMADEQRAREDAQALYDAGENRWGTDESKFISILATRSMRHLHYVFAEYEKISSRTMVEAIESELSGDLRKAYLAIAKSAMNKPRYFAEELVHSMKGAGTDDRTLIRIIVSRSEIDMKKIKEAFVNETGKTLEEWIADDVSGDYKKCLLSLVSE